MDTTQSPKITIFKNIRETQTPFHRPMDVVLDRIRNGASKTLVKKIRQEKDKSSRNELKKDLPAICFSGSLLREQTAHYKNTVGLYV